VPNSATYVAISVVVVCLCGIIVVFARLRSTSRLDSRGRSGYIAAMGIAWVALAVSAIANTAHGPLWWTIFGLAMLILIPSAVYTRLRK
jgi:small multidrug resistance pump